MFNLFYYFILLISIYSCNDSSNNPIIDIYGCTEPAATNYNEEANIDDGSCQHVQEDEAYYNVELSETGQSTLFIFTNTITSLDTGDEIAIFDQNAIIDSEGNSGSLLVGTGIWNSSQLEIVTIGGVDLSQFGGPILPGYVANNPILLKIWDNTEQIEIDVTYAIEAGFGIFDGLFTSINSIIIEN